MWNVLPIQHKLLPVLIFFEAHLKWSLKFPKNHGPLCLKFDFFYNAAKGLKGKFCLTSNFRVSTTFHAKSNCGTSILEFFKLRMIHKHAWSGTAQRDWNVTAQNLNVSLQTFSTACFRSSLLVATQRTEHSGSAEGPKLPKRVAWLVPVGPPLNWSTVGMSTKTSISASVSSFILLYLVNNGRSSLKWRLIGT